MFLMVTLKHGKNLKETSEFSEISYVEYGLTSKCRLNVKWMLVNVNWMLVSSHFEDCESTCERENHHAVHLTTSLDIRSDAINCVYWLMDISIWESCHHFKTLSEIALSLHLSFSGTLVSFIFHLTFDSLFFYLQGLPAISSKFFSRLQHPHCS